MKKFSAFIFLFLLISCAVFKKNSNNEEYEEASSVPPKVEDIEHSEDNSGTNVRVQAQLGEINSKLIHLTGEIENLHQEISDFKKTQNDATASLEERIKLIEIEIQKMSISDQRELEKYKNASSLFKHAKSQIDRDDRKAVFALRRLVEKYPHSTLVDDALYWLGEIYFKNQDYKGALIEFDKVRKNYPQGSVFVQAVFKEALCFENLGEGEQAKNLFQFLIANYPSHNLSKEFKKHLQE
ncbi:MAG: tetratricopeptide repeat protein [Deltaproteobacteria bacterium]|nr:tetratricopeptide repeat protein [Deltaproteobacteria bacterium]